MRKIQRFIIALFTCVIMSSMTVFATDEKLEKFVTTCFEDGYLYSNIKIKQINNMDYKIDFIYRENIVGMDYGFYLLPSMLETLTQLGLYHETYAQGNYAYISFSYTTDNLQYELKRLSILPYINVSSYINEDSKENVLVGEFPDTFFKEEMENNELVKDIMNSSYFSFEYKPIDDGNFSSNAPMKSDDGYYIWCKNGSVNTDIKAISAPISEGWFLFFELLIVLIIISIIGTISFVVYKHIVKKRKEKYNSSYRYNNEINDSYSYEDDYYRY